MSGPACLYAGGAGLIILGAPTGALVAQPVRFGLEAPAAIPLAGSLIGAALSAFVGVVVLLQVLQAPRR